MEAKKLISASLACALAVGIFTGCSSPAKTSPGSDSGSSSSAGAQPGSSSAGKTLSGKITVALPAGDYVNFMNKNVIPKFEAKFPGVQVSTETDTNIDTKISAGDVPDIYAGVFGYQPVKYAKLGKLVDYSQFQDYKELENRLEPNYVGKVLDGIYYVPWNATTTMMIYNKDLFKEAGLNPDSPPKTFDEFLTDAQKISALPKRSDGSKVYGTIFWNDVLTSGGWYWSMLAPIYYNMNGGKYQLFNKLGTDIVFDQPDAKLADFFGFLQKAQKYAPPTMEKNFFARNIGMWLQFGYGWEANLKEAKGTPMVIGKDVGVAPLPVTKAGGTSYSTLDGRSLMIFKTNASEQNISWELVKYLMQDDVNLQACETLGALPTLKSLESNAYFQLPASKPFVEQAKHALPNEGVAELDQVASIIQNVYPQVVMNGTITPQQAVSEAAAKSKKVLSGGQ